MARTWLLGDSMRNRAGRKIAADRDNFFAGELAAQFRIRMAREIGAEIFILAAVGDVGVQQAFDGGWNFAGDAAIAAEAGDALVFADGAAQAEVVGVDQLVA